MAKTAISEIQTQAVDSLLKLTAEFCEVSSVSIVLSDEYRALIAPFPVESFDDLLLEYPDLLTNLEHGKTFIAPATISDVLSERGSQENESKRIQFFAATTICLHDHRPIGGLILRDFQPKSLNDNEIAMLRSIAGQIAALIEIHHLIYSHNRDTTQRELQQKELLDLETTFRVAVMSMQEGLTMQSADGKIQLCNEAAERILGLSADQLIGITSVDPLWHLVREDMTDFPHEEQPVVRALSEGKQISNVIMGVYKPIGSLSWICINATPLFHENESKPYGVVTTFQDVTEKRSIDSARTKLAAIVESSEDAVIGMTLDGTIVSWNPAAEQLLGYKSEQALGLSKAMLYKPGESVAIHKVAQKLIAGEKLDRIECLLKRKDGVMVDVSMTYSPIRSDSGEVVGVAGIARDITDLKRYQSQIKEYTIKLEQQMKELEQANSVLSALSTTDGLTGLSNHRAFQERLHEEFSRAKRHKTELSLIMIDVDHFKQFNDSFGHPAGDVVLRRVAEILRDTARITDLVARYGGEEFILILPQTDIKGAMIIADRLRQAVEQNEWQRRPVTVSVGVSCYRSTTNDYSDILSEADYALYESKVQGRNRVSSALDINEQIMNAQSDADQFMNAA